MTVFTMISELGRGGFGIVHQVSDTSGSMYARKTFQINQNFAPTSAILDQLRKRFEREAKLQSGVVHKNIVPILEKIWMWILQISSCPWQLHRLTVTFKVIDTSEEIF